MSVVLHRKINARNLVLEEGQTGESIGVRRKDGSYSFVPWGGFIDVEIARALPKGRAVKLQASRVGSGREWALQWQDLGPGQHVQGCVFAGKAYAILERGKARIV